MKFLPEVDRESTLLTENEAALRLRLTPTTLRHWRRKGQGPKYCLIGTRAIRYRLGDIDAFIRPQEVN